MKKEILTTRDNINNTIKCITKDIHEISKYGNNLYYNHKARKLIEFKLSLKEMRDYYTNKD